LECSCCRIHRYVAAPHKQRTYIKKDAEKYKQRTYIKKDAEKDLKTSLKMSYDVNNIFLLKPERRTKQVLQKNNEKRGGKCACYYKDASLSTSAYMLSESVSE
jgi:hypothetical protein